MMLRPSLPVDEEARLRALHEYDLARPLDDASYLPILEMARELFRVPTAFISFVGRDRQVFAARRGLTLCETARDISFCAHAIAGTEMLVVLDAILDPRFADNPLVTGEPFIRFYAGLPLVSPSGHAIGTLCLVDTRPRRDFAAGQRRRLRRLADMVLDRLALRRLQAASGASQVRFENIAATSSNGIICADGEGRITFWNAAAERLFGYAADEAIGCSLDLIAPARLRHGHLGVLRRVAAERTPRRAGHLVELTARHAEGREFPVELSLSTWRDETGMNFGAILRDMTEHRTSEEKLLRLAHHDPLTDLPNRLVLRRRIEQLEAGTAGAALLVIDLDAFKAVNDDHGHLTGDVVLQQVAQRLLACVRSADTVARLGGDEFAALLGGVGDHGQAGTVADSMIRALTRPIVADGETISIGASVGIALYPGDGSGTDELMSNADLALYQAKGDGRHCHRVFTPALRSSVDRARAYDNELRRACDHDEFEVFYQPQVRLSDNVVVGAEALLRWRHPRDGLLLPAAFMAGLENRPISVEVGQWVLRTACRQAMAWREQGAGELRIGVNLFGSQLRSGDLVGSVRHALALSGLPAAALELEVTENILLRADDSMLGPLRALRADGVQIAFDDYGTGYTSLSMLKRFPVTRLKIDRSFVQGMADHPEDAAIVRAILYLARSLGFSAIAEGIENTDQAERLRRKGCSEVQGYLFGRPMPPREFLSGFGLATANRAPAPAPAGPTGSVARRPSPPPAPKRHRAGSTGRARCPADS
ncbi:MAG: putative bifunctional diguanylate cyclase/phosphodiesterase [Janthinobacterium lividum]